ncbi:cation diffusion facilitator family transporter [Psychrobacter sp. AOP22-C1-22]|uniref:cation diffusion facilitator family transporter n=1 Tax=unclassified Psychrobacter TaxID=196806 RepID=UPI001787D0E1|nr:MULTISPECIES: cation diffusion facilitator family transporter [unclassified Psychrobacter]MBE0407522.1 cation transporter [Psychrobacter sp. FME6]MBE0444355.1 cation transporter [Psychrobacter sp. FME5]
MNQNHQEPKKNSLSQQNDSANRHQHVQKNEENNYSSDTHHDHDEHLEQTVAPRDTKGYQRTLLFSFLIITGYMFVEAIGGLLTGSLALLSDAGHMLSDAIALGATLMAFKIGEKAATHQKTYGYKRFEILVATVNGATLVIIALMIFYEAIKRFNSPPEIASQGMLIVATIGMLVNILVAWLMHRGSRSGDGHNHGSHKDKHEANDAKLTSDASDNKQPVNLNMQSAYLHVLSDLMGSVAAIVAALLMMSFGWVWADAAASVIVAILIMFSGYRVVRDSVHILMEGTPEGISLVNVEEKLLAHPQVQQVHDLHVWSITSGLNALSCHVVVDGEMSIHESSLLIASLEQSLLELGIHHATIQVESSSHPQTNTHSDALVCDISEQAVEGNSHIGHNH